MSSTASIPRNALLWLLIAQMLVIAPHLFHIPLWIAGLWVFCALWRIQVYRTRWQLPRSIVKVAMMTSAAFAVYLSRGSLIGLDAGVALLVTAFTLKLVELRSRRDALVLVFLGFFAVVTSYLYDDSLLAALYSLLPVTALLAAWSGLQQATGSSQALQGLWRSLGLLGQAIPLAIVLFLFFPRMEPLWSLPQPGEKAKTGLSGHMSPGDIAELSQSTELAFRATFDGDIPPRNQLYWRALTMPLFDGRGWRISGFGTEQPAGYWQRSGPAQDYTVVMQASNRPWLYSLDISESSQPGVHLLDDFRLQRNRPVQRTYLYEARVWPQAIAEPALSPRARRQNLQLPRHGNPRSRAWARQLREQFADDRQLVNNLLEHFYREPYHYTLKPPRLGEHNIDEFLFDTRRGFCEHYSSSMTFLLRAAGVPARIVTGYQGGEINTAGNYVQVRQMDAHAWVEYWLPELGWQRVDPTFQVAPERIEQGVQEALSSEADLFDMPLLSPIRYRNVAWLNSLRMGWENLNHGWQVRVLGYQGDRQQAWLRQLFGQVNWQHIGLGLVAAVALILGLLALWLLKPWQQRPDPLQLLMVRFDRLMTRHGMERQPGEGLRTHTERCTSSGKLNQQQQHALEHFVSLHEQLRYAGNELQIEKLTAAYRQLSARFPRWR